jgi:hypothetical protein
MGTIGESPCLMGECPCLMRECPCLMGEFLCSDVRFHATCLKEEHPRSWTAFAEHARRHPGASALPRVRAGVCGRALSLQAARAKPRGGVPNAVRGNFLPLFIFGRAPRTGRYIILYCCYSSLAVSRVGATSNRLRAPRSGRGS